MCPSVEEEVLTHRLQKAVLTMNEPDFQAQTLFECLQLWEVVKNKGLAMVKSFTF